MLLLCHCVLLYVAAPKKGMPVCYKLSATARLWDLVLLPLLLPLATAAAAAAVPGTLMLVVRSLVAGPRHISQEVTAGTNVAPALEWYSYLRQLPAECCDSEYLVLGGSVKRVLYSYM